MAAVFAGAGLNCLFFAIVEGIPGLIDWWRGGRPAWSDTGISPELAFPPVALFFPLLLCAWGILRWKRWGHALGILISGAFLAETPKSVWDWRMHGTSWADFIGLAIVCLVVAWLLAPKVRRRYWREAQAT